MVEEHKVEDQHEWRADKRNCSKDQDYAAEDQHGLRADHLKIPSKCNTR